MSPYRELSSILIYKSDPNRDRLYTIPHKVFSKEGDLGKDLIFKSYLLLEGWKQKLEYNGHNDIEIYQTEQININGIDKTIYTIYHFKIKPYDYIVDVEKKFKLVKRLHGKEKAINWFNKIYESEAIKLLGEI